MDTRESIERFLVSYPELGRAERVVVAFSGGADSLSLLISLRERFPSLSIVPVYVNHNIRSEEELEKEIALNRSNCSKIGCELKVKTIKRGRVDELARELKISSEASARLLRYELLEEERADFILTAHTRSDQIELLFMRMLTGSSLKALIGIRPKRGIFLRPLIYSTRKDTEECCRRAGLSYAEDSTNDTDFCFRNRIRHQIDELLSSEERESLVRIAENLRLAEEREKQIHIERHKLYLEVEAEEYFASGPFSRNTLLEEVYSFFETDRMSDAKKREVEALLSKKGSAEFRHFVVIGDGRRARFFRRLPFFVSSSDLPCGLELVPSDDEKALRFAFGDEMVFRLAEEGDQIQLKNGLRKVSSLLAEYGVPYAIVLDTPDGIAALFSSFIGGRDRLSSKYLMDNSATLKGWKLI